MLCFQSVLYCIVLYNDVFTFLYVAVGNKLLLLLLLLQALYTLLLSIMCSCQLMATSSLYAVVVYICLLAASSLHGVVVYVCS